MSFASPWWLLMLPLIAALWWWKSRRKSHTTIIYSDISALKQIATKKTKWLTRLSQMIRVLILILIVVALARPQKVLTEREITTQGIDIMMVLDVSGSMAAEDLKPDNRLEVAKKTTQEFVSQRQADRVGLVVFGAEAYTQCPLTLDYGILQDLIAQVELNMAGDGTAIGMAMATALNRLKDTDAKSKIMILLTDGENNRGEIQPSSAANLAKELGVRVYTIGVGREGGARIPYMDPRRGKVYSNTKTYLDETTLKMIAKETDGRYYRATNTDALKDIFNQINKLEQTEIKTKIYKEYKDYFPEILHWIFWLCLIELLIITRFARVVP